MDYCIANIEESFNPMLSADFSAENTNGYRYGFNGMERDDDLNGVGNSYDFGTSIYDSRIARFLSRDPLESWCFGVSPYQFAGNRPIGSIDVEGLEEYKVHIYYNKDGDRTKIVLEYVPDAKGKTERKVAYIHHYPKKKLLWILCKKTLMMEMNLLRSRQL